ncbi:MAG: hypothetical protein U5L45_00475 [Saprospiraceae bacterium]|nr:hypothetical protein [Saprospiraceae bacterium]
MRYNANQNSFVDSSYNITNNPQLSWQGDFQRFCNNEPQIGASCDDGNANTTNDKIQTDCTCKGSVIAIDTTSCRYKDSLQLVAFYNATNGANWTNKWLLNQPITTWYGVRLNTEGCVQSINLGGNRLNGNLIDIQLPQLDTFILAQNSLNGSIPNFSGLPQIKVIEIGWNGFSNTIPNFNLPTLKILSLIYCQLSGSIPVFNRLIALEVLDLGFNQLTGTLPTFEFAPRLRDVRLRHNLLSGNIPKFNIPLLNLLWLDSNRLSGCIPRELKTNCPLIGATSGNIFNNPNLATQSWANYWNNNEGACTLTCRETDSLALAAFYRATNMQNLPPPYKWNLTQPMTTWYGVKLNATDCVECLDLDGGVVDCDNLEANPTGMGLVGTLPDSMRLLTSLVRLNVQGNTGLGGVFPTNFGSMTSLKHFFAYNCRFYRAISQ